MSETSYNDFEKKHASRKNSKTGVKLFVGSKMESEKRVKKAYSKMLLCQTKTTAARNEYLLSIIGINKELDEYYDNDIYEFMQ
eukprot:Pgem_evm1s11731